MLDYRSVHGMLSITSCKSFCNNIHQCLCLLLVHGLQIILVFVLCTETRKSFRAQKKHEFLLRMIVNPGTCPKQFPILPNGQAGWSTWTSWVCIYIYILCVYVFIYVYVYIYMCVLYNTYKMIDRT